MRKMRRDRNVSFTFSGGDVKLIYKRNDLYIKQLDAFLSFFKIFMLEKKIRNLFMIVTVLAPIVLYLFVF